VTGGGRIEEDVVLLPEVEARRMLRGRALRLQVVAPYGRWAGRGTLRVMRARMAADVVELSAGYEAYEPLGPPPAKERK
jgi:hypothetical protein